MVRTMAPCRRRYQSRAAGVAQLVVGNTLYFVADNGSLGRGRWRTDGTAAGAVLVKDIRLDFGSYPTQLTNVGGQLFFTAVDGITGRELWTSDGTSAGTIRLRQVPPLTIVAGRLPENLVDVDGTLYFTAIGEEGGRELWKSDGTIAGTVLVKDIFPGATGSFPDSLVNVNGRLFFTADDGLHGREVWTSDGTAQGTQLVKDLRPGPLGSVPAGLVNVGGRLVFAAETIDAGLELWTTNGTSAGTLPLADLRNGPTSSFPTAITAVNGRLLWTADDGLHGAEPWMIEFSANSAPTLEPIGNQQVEAGQSLVFQVVATDPNDPPDGLTFLLDAGAPAGATIDPQTGLFTWNTTLAQGPASYQITIRAVNNVNPLLSAAETIEIVVLRDISAPQLGPVNDLVAAIDQPISVGIPASETNDPPVGWTYQLDPDAPDGAAIEPLTGLFTWTPTTLGTFEFTVRVVSNADPNLQDSATFTIQVEASAGPLGNDTFALFDPSHAVFFFKNTHTPGAADGIIQFGPANAGWTPLAGDWNGNGIDTFGVFDPLGSLFYFKDTFGPGPADGFVQFGPAGAGWIPLVGDWDGDGTDTIGLFDPVHSVFYFKNSFTPGPADMVVQFGPAGVNWTPLAGDWDGNQSDTFGLYDPANGVFYLKNELSAGAADHFVQFGPTQGWTPLAGDWNASGQDSIALFAATTSTFFFRNTPTPGAADGVVQFGPAAANWLPLAGDWDGLTAGSPLLAAAGTGVGAPSLASELLDFTRSAALDLLAQALVDRSQLNHLADIELVIADLPGALLGLHTSTTIYIDIDAAGHGWFVDHSPHDNAEFSATATPGLYQAPFDSPAYGRHDLLTVVLHELGHALDWNDLDALEYPGHAMADQLEPGTRHVLLDQAIDELFP